MHLSPILLLHICGGTAGVLSGAVTLAFLKGSRRHGIAGIIFAISMMILAATGAYMALLKAQPGNVLGGTLTFYMVASAWMAARRRERGTDLFDWAVLLVSLAVFSSYMILGFQTANNETGSKNGLPAPMYFIMGLVALLAAIGDIRLLLRGGVFGTQRIARHLWRMCFALFVASGSIFLARQHLFPEFMRKTGMLYLLTFAPLFSA